MMTITNRLLHLGESGRGGWNRKQIEILGLEWPPRKGWQQTVLGKPITQEDAKRFVELNGATIRPAKERRSVITTDLPIPPGFPIKAETVFASFWLYVSRMDRETLTKAITVLEYITRKAKQETSP